PAAVSKRARMMRTWLPTGMPSLFMLKQIPVACPGAACREDTSCPPVSPGASSFRLSSPGKRSSSSVGVAGRISALTPLAMQIALALTASRAFLRTSGGVSVAAIGTFTEHSVSLVPFPVCRVGSSWNAPAGRAWGATCSPLAARKPPSPVRLIQELGGLVTGGQPVIRSMPTCGPQMASTAATLLPGWLHEAILAPPTHCPLRQAHATGLPFQKPPFVVTSTPPASVLMVPPMASTVPEAHTLLFCRRILRVQFWFDRKPLP